MRSLFDLPMPTLPILVTLYGVARSLTFLRLLLSVSISSIFIAILFALYQRRRIYKNLTACGLPTTFWRPRFVTFTPSNHMDSTTKLPSSNITNILPRMERLKGPYGMYGTVYGLSTPVIHVAHPVPARAVLSASPAAAAGGADCASITKHPKAPMVKNSSGATKAPAYDHFKNFCGEGVFTADGSDWKTKRAAVMHALLRVDGGYENAVEQEAHRAVMRLQEKIDCVIDQTVDIVPLLQRATIGFIYRYITHTDLDTRIRASQAELDHAPSQSQQQQQRTSQSATEKLLDSYLQSITRIRMIILAQSRSIWFLLPRWCFRFFSSMYQEEEFTMGPIRRLSTKACHEALPGSPLAELRKQPTYAATSSGKLSKNLLDEAITLLFAGQDTSAATLSWTLHLLSLYPAVQSKLAQEIQAVLGSLDDDTALSKRQLSNMPYLDAVVKESMRLFPVAPFVVRRLPYDLLLRDESDAALILPAHSFVCIWIYAMHRHPTFWRDPDIFLPERWLNEDAAKRDAGVSNGAYMPFATGPRNCLGQPLAHIILRVFLSRLIFTYEFRDDRLGKMGNAKECRKKMQAGFTILPQNGVHLTIRRRPQHDNT